MKTIYVFVFAAMLLLMVRSTGLFANTENCNAATRCCSANTTCTKSKKAAADISTFETNPFDILIPGNHF